MSHTVNLKLSGFERQPWGFRLHGGTDFGTPLLIQKVNVSSLSEAAGLQAGDILLAVNRQDVQNCRHKEAQDTIVRAGNNFEITVQRGCALNQALRPSSQTPVPQKAPSVPPTNGSTEWSGVLEANRAGAADNAEEFTRQFMSQLAGDTASNLPPQMIPNPRVNGQAHQTQTNSVQNHTRISTPTQQMTTSNPPQSHKMVGQYNSPQNMYSEDSIQEVLSQQAEMLSGGVKGINFNEDREVDLSNSETMKLVHELDNKGPEPEPGVDMDPSQAPSHYKGLANKNVQSYSFKMLQKALEGGSTNDTIVTNGTHDNGHLSLNNIHNVHAPKMNQKDVNGGGQRFCPSPSPSSTMPRTESPAPIQRPGSSQSLPRPGSSKQQLHQPLTDRPI